MNTKKVHYSSNCQCHTKKRSHRCMTNVWGKRSFSAAFPDDLNVNTVVAQTSVATPLLKPTTGPLVLDGEGLPVHIQSTGGATALAVTGPATITAFPTSLTCNGSVFGFDVHASSALVGNSVTSVNGMLMTHPSAAAIESNPGPMSIIAHGGALTMAGQTGLTVSAVSGNATINASAGDVVVNAPAGHILTSARSLLLNQLPVGVQTYQNTLQANYTPAGAGLVSAIPDASGPYFGWLAGWEQRVGWGWEYEFEGDLQCTVGSSNQLEVHVLGGPAAATPMFAQFTNAIANTGVGPFDSGYKAKLRFAIVSLGGAGTARVSMEFNSAKGGGDGLPVSFTQIVSDFAYDSTIQQVFTVQLKTADPAANLSILFAKGIQYG